MADFGLTEDMYGTNYVRRRKSEIGSEEKVPIRWMAPESIENDYTIRALMWLVYLWIITSLYHTVTGDFSILLCSGHLV